MPIEIVLEQVFFIIAGEAIFNLIYKKLKISVHYNNINLYGNEKRLADCAHHNLEFDVGSTEVAGE